MKSKLRDLMRIGTGPARRPTVLARLLGVMQGGVSLLQPVGTAFAAFMKVPARVAVDVANTLAEGFSGAGFLELTPEQRSQMGLEVDKAAIGLAPDVARALLRAPDLEKAIGEKGQALFDRLLQEQELYGVRKAVTQARALVGDARLTLQGWLHEAQGRLVYELFVDFMHAESAAERLQIAGDAGPALDPLEEQLAALRATQAENDKATAEQAAELERLDNDILLLRTMRAVNNKEPVDEALLLRMAKYYAERVPPG